MTGGLIMIIRDVFAVIGAFWNRAIPASVTADPSFNPAAVTHPPVSYPQTTAGPTPSVADVDGAERPAEVSARTHTVAAPSAGHPDWQIPEFSWHGDDFRTPPGAVDDPAGVHPPDTSAGSPFGMDRPRPLADALETIAPQTK